MARKPKEYGKGIPHPVDVHVGRQVKIARKMKGLSQTDLGDELGLTFQQIQKYEKGANRISASKLFTIAEVLDVPVIYFFQDLEKSRKPKSADNNVEMINDFASTSEGLKIIKAFTSIRDDDLRRACVNLIESIADKG